MLRASIIAPQGTVAPSVKERKREKSITAHETSSTLRPFDKNKHDTPVLEDIGLILRNGYGARPPSAVGRYESLSSIESGERTDTEYADGTRPKRTYNPFFEHQQNR